MQLKALAPAAALIVAPGLLQAQVHDFLAPSGSHWLRPGTPPAKFRYCSSVRRARPADGIAIAHSRPKPEAQVEGLFSLVPFLDLPKRLPNQLYAQYTHKRLKLESEYRRLLLNPVLEKSGIELADLGGWYASGSYRVHKRMELAAYCSRHVIDVIPPHMRMLHARPLRANNYDKALSVRFDLLRSWYAGIERHFADGFIHGISPKGLSPMRSALVFKTGFGF